MLKSNRLAVNALKPSIHARMGIILVGLFLLVAVLFYLEFINQSRLIHAMAGVSLVALSLVFSARWTTILFAVIATLGAVIDVYRAHVSSELPIYLPDIYLGIVLVWTAAALVYFRKRGEAERHALEVAARERQTAVVALATDPSITAGDIVGTSKQACEILSGHLGVARASVWFLSDDRSELRCVNLFEGLSGKHSAGLVLRASDYPRYFAALESGRAIDAHDARTDPRTSEYTAGYLIPLGITSMLDAGIRVVGRNFGVICCEHIGEARRWRPDELAFAGEIADQIAQSIVHEENQRVHEKVKANEIKYRDLVETSNDLIWSIDRNGCWTFVNRGPAERLLGYSPEEMTGRPLADFQTRGQAERDKAFLKRVWDGEQIFFHETIFRTKAGQPINLSFNAIALRGEDGAIVGATGTATDISERLEAENRRRALEEQLRSAQHLESLGRLAGGIAHDFNNLLGAILMNAEMIQTNPGEVPGGAESIVKAAHRGKSLISQILTFSRQVKLAKTRVELGSLAQEIEQLIRVTLPQNIALSVNVSGDAAVIADAGQMTQVVMNLCTNAVYAMKDKGGELRVEVASIPTGFVGAERISKLAGVGTDVVMLRVSDTGGGIPPAVKDRIFEPFFSTKPVGDGSGLGLSVVLGIVEAHGGQIHLDSTVGVGTVFELYFPKAAAISAELTPSEAMTSSTAPSSGSEHIVLVDDESMVLEVSAAALRQRGYTVSAFTEPEKVLESLGNGSFTGDILVTDLTMPRVTGIELARRLVAVYPDFPVILCSGYDLSGEDGTRDDSAVSARISKPYSIGELVTLVRRTLDEQRSKRSQRVSNQ